MTNDIKAGSKLLAEFEGIKKITVVGNNTHVYNEAEKAWHKTRYHADYNELMRCFQKFADLDSDIKPKDETIYGIHFQNFVSELVQSKTPERPFKALVECVNYLNSLKPKEEKK